MMKRTMILGIVLIITLMVASPTALAVTPTEINVPDTALNHALHDALGTAYSEPLLDTQVMMLSGTLDFSGLGIADLTGLEYLQAVSTLDLSDNAIEQVPEAFCTMLGHSSIKKLNLSDNKLSRLPDAIGSSLLTELDLSLNGFFSVPAGVTEIDSLVKLNVSGNKLGRLPSALASMPVLDVLWVEANRIESLPSSFKNLAMSDFRCNYNFLDLTAEADNKDILDDMTVTTLYYEDQLKAITGLAASYPQAGAVTFAWDACEDLDFGSGVVARVSRVSILLGGTYIGEVTPDACMYTHEGLTVGDTYKFQFSWDYKISGTAYNAAYTKLYITQEVVPQAEPDPTGTPVPTDTPEPSATLDPTTAPTATAAATATSAPSAGPTATPAPSTAPTAADTQTSSAAADGIPAGIIILLVVVIVLLLVALGILLVYILNRR